MTKLFLSVAAICAFGVANAQDATTADGKGFANGDAFILGSAGYTSDQSGELGSMAFNIMPQVGFFVSDNIVVGGLVGYLNTTEDRFNDSFDPIVTGTYEAKTSAITIGAFSRYYATPASDFSFFGELGAAYITGTAEDNRPGTEEFKVNGFTVAVSPGVSYFISDNFALEAAIGALQYTTVKPDLEGADSTDNFRLELNLSDVQFGLIYKF